MSGRDDAMEFTNADGTQTNPTGLSIPNLDPANHFQGQGTDPDMYQDPKDQLEAKNLQTNQSFHPQQNEPSGYHVITAQPGSIQTTSFSPSQNADRPGPEMFSELMHHAASHTAVSQRYHATGFNSQDTSGSGFSGANDGAAGQSPHATGFNTQDTSGPGFYGANDGAAGQSPPATGNTQFHKQLGASNGVMIQNHAPDSHSQHEATSGTVRPEVSDGAPDSNSQKQLKSSDDTGAHPPAPKDSAKFTINVDWQGECPKRWKIDLQKALQTWCKGTLDKIVGESCSVHTFKFDDNSLHRAEVEITPSKALDALKEMKQATLNAKDQTPIATVHFLVEEKTEKKNKMHHQSAKVRNLEMNAHGKSLEKDKAGMDVDAVKNIPNEVGMSESTSADSVTLPEHLYWYLNNAYRKEINQIEKDCGVTINSEVAVSFTAQDTTQPDSVLTAKQRFSDLVQRDLKHPEFVTIPYTHLNPEILQKLLFYVATEEAKLVFKMSADNCQLIGPRSHISVAKKEMNLESEGMPSGIETDIMDASKSISRPLEMDFREAQTQLEMHEAHWNLLTIACEEQICRIQQKYGVNIDGKSSGDTTTVTATSLKKQHVNLESHAVRELIHLYQKVATSVVTCSLKNTDDKDNVKKVLEKIHPQKLRVVSSEIFGSWKLIGLPEHLVHAIAEIEKQTGCNVFDDKTKQELGDFFQGKQNELGQWGKGAASWANESDMKSLQQDNFELNRKPLKGEKTNGKENEGGNEEDDKCPICLDNFTEKQKLKCGHEFCKDCLAGSVKSLGKSCPVCKDVFGKLIGNQPDGKMTSHSQRYSLPGFPYCGTIEIDYFISSGIQTAAHPNPGQRFSGTQRHAYLPDNKEGQEVLALLKRAFDQKLIFTVGTSTTTGQNNAVTWNDIHHKTRTDGGPHNYGYPDADYLKRVKDELKAKGIE